MTHQPERKIYAPYVRSLLPIKISLTITEIGKNVKQNLENKIRSKTEGRCISDGYIKPNSITIVSYSSGAVNSENIEFHAVYECMVCYPVEGMLVVCNCKTITKAGIHAQVIDDNGNMPMTVFIARDHHNVDHRFSAVKENTMITVKVVGIRFELNDPYICTIGKLVEHKATIQREEKPRYSERTRLKVGGDINKSGVLFSAADDN